MGRVELTVVLAVVLLASGCGSSRNAEAVKASSPESSSGGTPMVTVVAAEVRAVSASVQVTGSFAAKESSDVAPQSGGRVIETPVDVGAFEKEGEIIAKLEDRDAQLRLDQAQAAEQQAEA